MRPHLRVPFPLHLPLAANTIATPLLWAKARAALSVVLPRAVKVEARIIPARVMRRPTAVALRSDRRTMAVSTRVPMLLCTMRPISQVGAGELRVMVAPLSVSLTTLVAAAVSRKARALAATIRPMPPSMMGNAVVPPRKAFWQAPARSSALPKPIASSTARSVRASVRQLSASRRREAARRSTTCAWDPPIAKVLAWPKRKAPSAAA